MFSQYLSSRYLRTASMLLVLGILTGLFAGGAHPVAVNLVPSPWDKLVHAVIFAVLTGAIGGAASGIPGWRRVGLAFLGATLIGLFDECHQMYLPGRKPGWDDFAADVTGSLIGIALLRAEWRRRN
ncbi:VanZ family protein [Nitrosospira multiformis]|nr:VanZ family protein [Nitrosospira multiformis]